ncbi:MAG: hypothetical protein D6762_02585 [Candidatus Neomarinimicrobiota bacterium]|nr:MAG: hypothetical protein D6762_02585 [Candidatus Neomarinimicrobiota bacterium]
MCDTFVVLPPATAEGTVILGKNSDREPNEIQSFEFHPPADYPESAQVQCTYETVPQVRHTLGVWLSRPFWMWGAEMGVNEKGVAIGNEAVFTKMPLRKDGGLTGMDLIRLALERGESAENALEVILQFLADVGQGGICGFTDKTMAYHNSFLIADPSSAWILETAGEEWVAKRVDTYATISNGLTIGDDFDRSSPTVIDTARRKGWLKSGETFSFARCYSDWFYTTFSASRKRKSCSHRLIEAAEGSFSVAAAFRLLRDHGGEPYHPDGHFLLNRICAHAANRLSRFAAQSTNSMIAELRTEGSVVWSTGTSAPCTGVYLPHRITGEIRPEDWDDRQGVAYWLRHEHLHREVLRDFAHRIELYRQERDEWETTLREEVSSRGLDADRELALRREAGEREKGWLETLRDGPIHHPPLGYYRGFWRKQNRKLRRLQDSL